MRIAILGMGPSAAYAYRACVDFGIASEVDVFGTLPKQLPAGAFWLHKVPLTIRMSTQHHVLVTSTGKASMYTYKMWGREIPSSFPTHPFVTEAFNPSEVLPLLWEGVRPIDRGPLSDADIIMLARDYDWVFQTFPSRMDKDVGPKLVPLPILVREVPAISDGFCLYNGEYNVKWVRMTTIFGRQCIEFPASVIPSEVPPELAMRWSDYIGDGDWTMHVMADLPPETQPVKFSLAPNVVLVGRFATWNRKVLSHEAYQQVMAVLGRPA